ncbi:GNAT family N-acetyltransferase [Planktotalea sp.]|uniref:GNAT family N-acetyltransferase n=1 Tax=Planktotalea sp. TaxID=2029877 RepID=UPI003D6A59E7
MNTIELTPYCAGDHGWLVEAHQTLYAQDEGFDETFGPLVDQILTEFENTSEGQGQRGWIARKGSRRLGSIFCVRLDEQTAKLRMFLLVPEARGQGVGRLLLRECMSYAKKAGYARMTLWTHASHISACALYAKFGWSCVSSKPVKSFGVDLIEQQWEIAF